MPDSVAIKLPTDELIPVEDKISIKQFIMNAHQAECNFYKFFSGRTPTIPQVFYSQLMEPEQNGVIVMKNFSRNGVHGKLGKGLTLAQVFKNFYVENQIKEGQSGFEYIYGAAEQLGHLSVICHGDHLWMDNLLFNRSNPDKLLALIDWQFAHAGSYTQDLGVVITMSLSGADRRLHTNEILKHYHNRLSTNLVDSGIIIQFEEILKSYDYLLPASIWFWISLVTQAIQTQKVKEPEEKHWFFDNFHDLLEDLCALATGVPNGSAGDPGDTMWSATPTDYVLTVVVWEAKQLAGAEINPYIVVKIGEQEQKTKIKKVTNDPRFEETFLFEFQLPPAVFMEQILSIAAYHVGGGILNRKSQIGIFRIDMATIWDTPKKFFFHRWAVLIDDLKPMTGPKGYVCCDLIVSKRGEVQNKVPSMDIDPDVEANLLLPDEMFAAQFDRVPARYSLSIHSAQWLPNVGSVAFAAVRKYWSGTAPQDLVDPFVQVTFAGQTGKTRVRNDTSSPEWNEQIIFYEMFPPLTRKMRIHIRDDDGNVVATTFLDLNTICDHGLSGYMPTFGPAYKCLYGALRDTIEVTPLNFGLGEGVCFRGRLCMSLRVEAEEHMPKKGFKNVVSKSTLPLPYGICGSKQEYLLFCSILKADMIDNEYQDCPLHFELSIGPIGSQIHAIGAADDWKSEEVTEQDKTKDMKRSKSQETIASMESMGENGEAFRGKNGQQVLPGDFPTEGARWCSRTLPINANATDENYCSLGYGSKQPCMFIYTLWEDQRMRLFEQNLIRRAKKIFQDAVADTQRYLEMDSYRHAEKRLRKGLDLLASACSEFVTHSMTVGDASFDTRETPLDKKKRDQRCRDLQEMMNKASDIRQHTNKENVHAKLIQAQVFSKQLAMLSVETQETIPDVFLWLISGRKRIAYQRLSASELIFAEDDHERGSRCGKVNTFFMKKPGALNDDEDSGNAACHVTAYLWFGLTPQMTNYLNGLPPGFWPNRGPKNPLSDPYNPPTTITYREVGVYELRVHLFQARALLPADESGLSDPYVRVVFHGQVARTQTITQTVNPVWDETLIIPAARLYGSPENIEKTPPEVILQVYDADDDGSSEYLGIAQVHPLIKLHRRPYEAPRFPPVLYWVPVYKAGHRVGEILGTFELFELARNMRDYPRMPEVVEGTNGSRIMQVPRGIRPVLGKFRIEMMFWGCRQLKSVGTLKRQIEHPTVELEIAGQLLASDPIEDYKKRPTFDTRVKICEVMLPVDPLFRPPLMIRCFETRAYGRQILIGSHAISSIDGFLDDEKTDDIKIAMEEEESLPEKEKAEIHEVQIESGHGSMDDDEEQTPQVQETSLSNRSSAVYDEIPPTYEPMNQQAPKPLMVDEFGRFIEAWNPDRENNDLAALIDSNEMDSYSGHDDFPSLPFAPLQADYSPHAEMSEREPSLYAESIVPVRDGYDDDEIFSYGDDFPDGNRPDADPADTEQQLSGVDKYGLLLTPRVPGSGPAAPASTRSAAAKAMQQKNKKMKGGLDKIDEMENESVKSYKSHMDGKSVRSNVSHRSRASIMSAARAQKIKEDQAAFDNATFTHGDDQEEDGEDDADQKEAERRSKSASVNDLTEKRIKEDAAASMDDAKKTLEEDGGLSMDVAKKKPKKKGKGKDEVVLDWWSKYYTSLNEKNLVARNAREKLKQQRTKNLKSKLTLSDTKDMAKRAAFRFFDAAAFAGEGLKRKLIDENMSKKGDDDLIPVRKSGPTVDADASLIPRMKIYDEELENQEEFNRFMDVIRPFRLKRGKQTFNEIEERKRYVGMFKGNIKMTVVHNSDEQDPHFNLPKHFTHLPSPDPVKVLGMSLKAADSDGMSDPYLILSLGKQKINDKANRFNRTLNPVFGSRFDFETHLPGGDSELCVQVWDYDRSSVDDLIGQTYIDLEQRYYSKHLAAQPIPSTYEKTGFNAWPYEQRPVLLLTELCGEYNIKAPEFKKVDEKTRTVTLNGKLFKPDSKDPAHQSFDHMALYVLHRWHEVPEVGFHLVPDHVEKRSLYIPEEPGMEQGALHMFIHMFKINENLQMPPEIDIAPRKPKVYELRATIWNTQDIPLDDVSPITGCASVDQYIKGFVIDPDFDLEQTDVHYRSLNGEGNFNWRLIWRFNYLDAEEKISHRTKAYWYSLVEYEDKLLPRLTLEVWDADQLTSDDCLGSLLIDLNKLPRGAKQKRGCDLSLMKVDAKTTTVNLFRTKRIRGWYPFESVDNYGKPFLAGMVDLELNMLTEEEAEARPAGKGHDPPEPLPEPMRPETSFAWFASPLKFLQYGIWDGLKYKCLVLLVIVLLFLFVATFIYTFPEAVANKMVL